MPSMIRKELISKESLNSNVQHLKPQCEHCFGLCCAALYFSKQDGFPADKNAGTPCTHLADDFRCAIHDKLGTFGCKGCMAFECFGAGQRVSQITFGGKSWREAPELASSMFEVFLIMSQLHEICWYLTEALTYEPAASCRDEIREALQNTERLTLLPPQALLEFNSSIYHEKISALLRKAGQLVINEITGGTRPVFRSGGDYTGRDLRKKNGQGADLRGAYLIAANLQGVDLYGANLIGADLRDANLKDADLSGSLFLTQFQINTAKGNSHTKLPLGLTRPEHWR